MSVPTEDEPVPLSHPVKDRRDRSAIAVTVAILAFVVVGVLKPWTAFPSPRATPSASAEATVASSQAASSFAAPSATAEGVGTIDKPVIDDVWRRVGPVLRSDAILAAVHGGIDAIDPGSGIERSFLTCACDPTGALAVSQGGSSLAYGDVADGTTYIRILDLATLRSNAVMRCDACTTSGFDLSWSPDERWLAFSPGAGGVWTAAVDGSVVRQALTTGRSPTFSPDGARLLLDGVGTVNLDGTGFAPLGLGWALGAAWSPDGSRLAYATTAPGPSTQAPADNPSVEQLWVANIDGSHRAKIAERPGCCVDAGTSGPVWSPDGTRLIWRADARQGLVAVRADGKSSQDLAVGAALLPVRPAWVRVPAASPPRGPAFLHDEQTGQMVIGQLGPGTYEDDNVDGQGFNLRFTLPAGWSWDGSSLYTGAPLFEGAVINFSTGDVQVFADPCHWARGGPNPPTRPEVAALITALAAQPMRNVTAPIIRPSAPRWFGMAVELNVAYHFDPAACDGGELRSWSPQTYFLPSLASSELEPGRRDYVWAVQVDTRLIIDAASFTGTPSHVRSDIEAILKSIYIGHWG